MIKKLFFFFLLIVFTKANCQINNFKEKFLLPEKVAETSGLLFFNGKVLTHNDSGGENKLFEIDTVQGNITREISISNATNIDWEDITDDETHIYIGDFGNNNGTRTDLKIYKILKSEVATSTNVAAEIINFSYEDQTDFSSRPNNHNFDAEGFVVYQNQLLIFTKNWVNLETNVYSIPTDAGNYSATKTSSFNVDCLVTGASYNSGDDSFFLSCYSRELQPFLHYVSQNREPGTDILASGTTKIDLTGILEQGSQVEGITFFNNEKYYLSRELFSRTINGMPFVFLQKLYEFESQFFFLLSLEDHIYSKKVNIYPNPVVNSLKVENNSNISITSFTLYNSLGKELQKVKEIENLNWYKLAAGNYFLVLEFVNGVQISKRVVKN